MLSKSKLALDVCRDHQCLDQELSWHITPSPLLPVTFHIHPHPTPPHQPTNYAPPPLSLSLSLRIYTYRNAVGEIDHFKSVVWFVKMAVNSTQQQSQDSLNVVKLPDEGTTGPLCESHLDMVNLSNLNLVKTLMDAQANGGNHANLKNDSADVYGSYCLAIDIDKGKFEAPKSTEEMSGNAKTDDCISSMFQRKISSLMGGKFMQLLMNNSIELPKFACKDKCLTEKVYDIPSNRLRKYKRSASFNSRRVVLLFSFLSCIGTIILIYLTLRVRMSGDWAANV